MRKFGGFISFLAKVQKNYNKLCFCRNTLFVFLKGGQA